MEFEALFTSIRGAVSSMEILPSGSSLVTNSDHLKTIVVEVLTKLHQVSPEFVSVLRRVFVNHSSHLAERDIRNFVYALVDILRFCRLRVILVYPDKFDPNKASTIRQSLQERLPLHIHDPQLQIVQISGGSTKVQFDVSAFSLLFYSSFLSSGLGFQSPGTLSKICDLTIPPIATTFFRTHIGASHISPQDATHFLRKTEQLKKIEGNFPPLFESLCLSLGLDPWRLLELWKYEQTARDAAHQLEDPHDWILSRFISHFSFDSNHRQDNLYRFGFTMDMSARLSLWLNRFPAFHCGSLLLSWAEARIFTSKGSGMFYCPLSDDFQRLLQMPPDSSQPSSSFGISSEKGFTILRRDLSASSTSEAAGILQGLNLGADREGIWLFHGTCLLYAQDIVHDGVSNQLSTPWCDFGPGYYLTPDFHEAVFHATKLRKSPDLDNAAVSPCVVCYLVETVWKLLPEKPATRDGFVGANITDAEEWIDRVTQGRRNKAIPAQFRNCRILNKTKPIDLIIGPISQGKDPITQKNETQYCFRSLDICEWSSSQLESLVFW